MQVISGADMQRWHLCFRNSAAWVVMHPARWHHWGSLELGVHTGGEGAKGATPRKAQERTQSGHFSVYSLRHFPVLDRWDGE